MTEIIENLQHMYFYFTIGGRRCEIPMTVVVIVVLALLLILLGLLISIIIISKTEENHKAADKESDDNTFYFEEVVEPAAAKTLNQIYAEKRNWVICPFCETFNSRKSVRCCGCGQVIQK